MSAPTLIFVYNADSGVLNGLKDLWIKTATPEQYSCQLCAVTYGLTGMKREWRDFVRGLGRPVRFLHRDEVEREYGVTGLELPAAYEQRGTHLLPVIRAAEMRACTTLEDLRALVNQRLAA
jgi:hypothetical protein